MEYLRTSLMTQIIQLSMDKCKKIPQLPGGLRMATGNIR